MEKTQKTSGLSMLRKPKELWTLSPLSPPLLKKMLIWILMTLQLPIDYLMEPFSTSCMTIWASLRSRQDGGPRWCSHCRRCEGFACRHRRPDAPTPTLITWSGAGILLLLQDGEGVAGWPYPLPGYHQQYLGRGHQDHRHWRVRCRLLEVVGPQPKVCSNRR